MKPLHKSFVLNTVVLVTRRRRRLVLRQYQYTPVKALDKKKVTRVNSMLTDDKVISALAPCGHKREDSFDRQEYAQPFHLYEAQPAD